MEKGTGGVTAKQLQLARYSRASCVVVFAFAALALMLFLPGGAGAVRSIDTSVSAPDPEPAAGSPLAFERISDAGAKWTRVILFWSDIAPAKEPTNWNPKNPGDPNYRWERYDAVFQDIKEAGLRPFAAIYSAPPWAERCKSEARPAGTCNPDPKMFADFAEAAARRYSGDFRGLPHVSHWKAWNEPNLPGYYRPQYEGGKKVSPGRYRIMVNSLAERVKKVRKSNQVIGGGLAPFGGSGRIAPLDFMKDFFCVTGNVKTGKRLKKKPGRCPGKPRVDIWAYNPYTPGRPTRKALNRDDMTLGDLSAMRTFLNEVSRLKRVKSSGRRIPAWITEISWDSNKPDPKGVPMKILTHWVSETIYRAWEAKFSVVSWLTLRDWRPSPTRPERSVESGLYFRGSTLAEDKPKPILRAFRFPFVSFRVDRGIKVWGRTPDSRAGTIRLKYSRTDGSWQGIGSLKAGSNGFFSRTVRTGLGRSRKGVVKAELVRGGRVTEESAPFPLKLDNYSSSSLPWGS